MQFLLIPEEAQELAILAGDYLKRRKFKVTYETPLSDDAPYRTSLVARNNLGLVVVIEAQSVPKYTQGLRDLVRWLASQRAYSEVAIATKEDAPLSGRLMKELKDDGVGLMIVSEEKEIDIAFQPRNPALTVAPDPTLTLGSLKPEVIDLVSRFNGGERKPSLREMCDTVEGLTGKVSLKAAKKGRIKKSESEVEGMDWSARIEILASPRNVTSGRTPLLSQNLKLDLHSFRGARNLLNHPARTKREAVKLDRQLAERMMMGPRLLSELLRISRSLR